MYLQVQEQQHRLGLQAELEEAETAAADLRQMLTIFFGESHHGSPNSSPNTPRHNTGLHHDSTWGHAPSQLSSGLPGTLNRADSRLQLELAGIQNRLKKIAQLRDNIPCSSPRSADRISPWLSLSANGNTSPTGELGRMRTLGRISPVKTSPLKADSLQTSSDDTRIRSINTRHQGLPSGLATSTGADAASNSEAEDHANADAESIDGSQSGCNTDE